MKMLAGKIAALALVGATSASAQIVYPGAPYPAPPAAVVPAPAPRIVAPAPYVWPNVPGYIPGPYPGSVVVNPYTGRWCTYESSGWHWCWRP
jgi:hypothetical protein